MIAINAAILDRQPSGLGVFVRELAAALSRIRKDVVVFCPDPDALPDCAVRPIPRWLCERRGFILGGLIRFLGTQVFLPLMLKKAGAKVLLTPNHEVVLFPPCPQVVVIHDLLPLLFPESYPKLKYYYRHVLPWALGRAAAIVADSENTKKDLMRHYGIDASRIVVIHAGIDAARFRAAAGRPSGEPYLLFVGNQHPYKNLARLIEAFSGLVKKGFPHRLLIAGKKDPWRFPALSRKALELGVEDRVKFLDYVSDGDLPSLYSRAELFVLPSLYEGFGFTVLEAMACGCPVAASNGGSLPEICAEAACALDPADSEAMTARLAEVLGDPQRRQRMVEAGYRNVRRFNWEKAAESYAALLSQALIC